MAEQIVQLMVGFTAIALGIMNYLKHQHLERDMKRFPLVLTIELAYDDNLQPVASVREVRRSSK